LQDSSDDNDCYDASFLGSYDKIYLVVFGTSQFADCYVTPMWFNISSIPDGSDVTDTDITFDVDYVSNMSTQTCEFVTMGTTTSSSSIALVSAQIYFNSNLVSDTSCRTTGVKTVDLGTSADSYVESNLSDNTLGFGMRMSYTNLSDTHEMYSTTTTADTFLTITYTVPAEYTIDLLDVYESSSTTLDSGISICIDVDLESASSCLSDLITGRTYRFEVKVDNIGGLSGFNLT